MKEFDKQKHFLMDVFKSQAYVPMKKKELEILLDVEKDKRNEFGAVLAELVEEERQRKEQEAKKRKKKL